MHVQVIMPEIAYAEYDVMYGVLEVKFRQNGQIWQFYDVPETVWYGFCKSGGLRAYINTNIIGMYPARKMN